MNLMTTFAAQAAARPNQIAIIDGRGRAITYGDLSVRAERLAGAWRHKGIARGDRLLLAMGIGIDLYVALAAAWRIGAVVVFPEPAMGLNGLRHAARVTAPKAFLSSGVYRLLGWVVPELRALPLRLTPDDQDQASAPLADVDVEHPALISFTSGSTGTPKAIVRSHAFLAAQNECIAGLLKPKRVAEVDLVAFPVFVVANLALGVTSVLPNWNVRKHDHADADAIAALIARHGVTRALIPPSVCERLASLAHMPPLEAMFTGGGPVFPSLLRKLAAKLPYADIVAVYGSTEAEPIAHLHVRDIKDDDWTAMEQGAGLLAGAPIPEIELRIDDAEILVTGAHVNKGYLDSRHNAGNKSVIDGAVWHRTGDAGRLDGEGRLWLLGRHEARINGLYPFPVEVSAMSWPGVRRAALVALNRRAVLAVEGDRSHEVAWRSHGAALGDIEVVAIDAIPLDRRHLSKVDYAALLRTLERT
jgi:acyl-CoA synthetase (AMP-forming)/AMP-acid ligase II